ncbi:hypothetical protein LTV02_33340 [Nocardia yamanashiensis]|uniref:Rv0361 family membrane protein n=1 Tax=Nocardia yamanashiensis TaxID=209247 RepID=UPI000834FD69|nr:hypothetical protein [Nocardia yamanashiensis]UGT40814.1 hypothetical protein LTV02_33340 [Nocardia yamanashiensis]
MSDVDDQPVPIDQDETRTMLPFLVAAVVIVLVILGIVIAALVSPAEKNVTDSDRLAIAARTFTDSRSGTDVIDKSTACSGFDEAKSPLAGKPGEQGGKYAYVKLVDPRVEGEKATALVTWRAGDRESTTTWHFSKQGSAWLVCDS